jgi:hypothetical protein
MRIKRGERLNLDDPMIGHEKLGVKKFNRTTKIGFPIKECIVKVGFSWRPYILWQSSRMLSRRLRSKL